MQIVEPGPNVITDLIKASRAGDTRAREALVQYLLPILRDLAVKRLSHDRVAKIVRPTELIHEALLRLYPFNQKDLKDRIHLKALAATVIKNLITDYARRAKFREFGAAPLEEAPELVINDSHDWLLIDELLDPLRAAAPLKAQVFEMRVFGDLRVEEISKELKLSPATVKRYWDAARAFLKSRLTAPQMELNR
jgi:RNA polymerase sigma factor (TIGR02999 family)